MPDNTGNDKRATEIRLSRIIQTGTPEEKLAAVNELAERNMGFAKYFAKKYVNQGIDYDDIVQEGCLGLLRAAESYDAGKGPFASYARFWIKRTINRAIQNQGRGIRFPAHRHEKLARLRKAREELLSQNGEEPTIDELAARLNMFPEDVAELLESDSPITSLDTPVGDGSTSIGQMIPDDALTCQEFVEREETKQMLLKVIDAKLNDREKLIIKLKFGLTSDKRAHNLTEISEIIGLSRERVRQIAFVAISKIRDAEELVL